MSAADQNMDAGEEATARLQILEAEMLRQQGILGTISTQLQALIATAQNPNPPPVPPAPPIPPVPPVEDIPAVNPAPRRAKPATPSDFDGDRAKGQAFLNSCELYLVLAPEQFVDDAAKVYWAISYMKSGRAALFSDSFMRRRIRDGFPPYSTWAEFRSAFVRDFCPKNEEMTARLKLEGTRDVKEYIDEFQMLIE